MKVTSLLGERYKDSSFEIESQNLMTRGGYIKQVGGGLYSLYTPAKRIQNKIEESDVNSFADMQQIAEKIKSEQTQK